MKKLDLLEGKEYLVFPGGHLYQGFVGSEKWIIVTELTETELIAKYDDIAVQYQPWILITIEQYSVMVDWKRNEEKHRRRSYTNTFSYGIDDSYIEKILKEDALTDTLEDELFADREGSLDCLKKLTPRQRQRIVDHFLYELPYRAIAEKEDITYHAVADSVKYGVKKMREYYEDLCVEYETGG